MYNIILNPLSQFENIDFLYFEASLIDNIHISFARARATPPFIILIGLIFFK